MSWVKATNENILNLKPGDFYIHKRSDNNFCKWKVLKYYWKDNKFIIDVITDMKTDNYDAFGGDNKIGTIYTGFVVSNINFSQYKNIYIEFSLEKKINKLLEL